jgi:hypothetical protein
MMPLEQSRLMSAESSQLSHRQKRQLLELAAAGVLSVVFFAAPLFLIRNVGVSTAPMPQVRQSVESSAIPRVQIITTDVPAPVSTPALQAMRPTVPRMRQPAPVRPHGKVASARTRVPFGRRLARLFAGDGTHTVQPFPTLPATER